MLWRRRTREPFRGKRPNAWMPVFFNWIGNAGKEKLYEGHLWENGWDLNTHGIDPVTCRKSFPVFDNGLWLRDGVYLFLGNIHWNAFGKASRCIQLSGRWFSRRTERETHMMDERCDKIIKVAVISKPVKIRASSPEISQRVRRHKILKVLNFCPHINNNLSHNDTSLQILKIGQLIAVSPIVSEHPSLTRRCLLAAFWLH